MLVTTCKRRDDWDLGFQHPHDLLHLCDVAERRKTARSMRLVCQEWIQAVDAEMLHLNLPSMCVESRSAPLFLRFAGVQRLSMGSLLDLSSCNDVFWEGISEISRLEALRSLSLNMRGCGNLHELYHTCTVAYTRQAASPIASEHACHTA